MWDLGVVVICIWGNFELLVLNVILRSFAALVSAWSKWPVIGTKVWDLFS